MNDIEFSAEDWNGQPTILLVSGDAALCSDVVQQARNHILKSGDFLHEKFNSSDHKFSDALERYSVFSLWGEKRLIEFNSDELPAESDREALSNLSEKTDLENILILKTPAFRPSKWLKAIKSKVHFISCQAPKPWHVKTWLIKKARERQLDLSDKGATELIERVGTQLGSLDNALTLMELSGKPSITWDETRIQEFFLGETQNNVFKLADALADHDLNKSLECIESFLSRGMVVPQLVGGLRLQFKRLLQLKMHGGHWNRETMMAKLNMRNSTHIKKTEFQASKFSLAHLKNIYKALYQLDRESKMTGDREKDQLEMFIFEVIFG